MSAATANLTADHCAHAIIAASRLLDVDPIKATLPRSRVGRPRLLAAHAIKAMIQPQVSRSGATRALARIFQVSETRLAPSGLVQAGLTADALLEVAEAVRAAGFTGRIELLPPAIDPVATEAAAFASVADRLDSVGDRAAARFRLRADVLARQLEAEPAPAVVCEPKKQTPAPASKLRPAKPPKPAAPRAPVQLRPQEAAPPRQRDVSIEASDKLRAMFAGDAELIRRSNAQGGFPRAVRHGDKTFLLDASNQNWSHRP